MLYALLTGILILAMYVPQMWVRYIMWKHGATIEQIPGTGGELATHLIERFDLKSIGVEQTLPRGDHFDPTAKMVRLSPSNYEGKSLTAIAVATHEVGHALQFDRNERVFQLRAKYLPGAMVLKKVGITILAGAPLLAFVMPTAIIALIAISLLLQLLGALAYLIVLPEEWDASFNKALPILAQGDYVPEQHLGAIRAVLQAAALTYFAAALAETVNIGRWLLVLRR
ncbi:MAG: zinc metallopeptidase [Proteobacteria bacterium]|nr:zinc metallopeptidase [Pseudomonadota bacterium]